MNFYDFLLGIDKCVTVRERMAVGTFLQLEDRIYRVRSCHRKNADDWFADEEYELTLEKPWRDRTRHEVPGRGLPIARVEWMEDKLLPRLTSV